MTSFRCPAVLMDCVNQLIEREGTTKAKLVMQSIKKLNKQVNQQKGQLLYPVKQNRTGASNT